MPMPRITTALLAGALFLSPGFVGAQESQSLEQVVGAMAKTPADHAALAKHYEAKAAAARASASEHESMAKSYAASKLTERVKMQEHCKKLAHEYKEQAAQYDALAKLEEAEAKKTP